jgi:hypothetical protein
VPSKKQWVYARVTTVKVPALMDDGVHIDTLHPKPTYFLEYPAGSKTTGTNTWWGHEYANGETYCSHGNQKKEGVADLDDIKEEISTKGFVLLESSGSPLPDIKDTIWTNTILMPTALKPRQLDVAAIKKLSENLLASIPTGRSWGKPNLAPLIIGTVRTANNEEIVVMYRYGESKTHDTFVAELMTATNNPGLVTDVLKQTMSKYPVRRVYVFGDPLTSIDFRKLASDTGMELIVRPSTTIKDFHRTERRIEALGERHLARSNTAMVNATPATLKEVQLMGDPSSSLDGWRKIRQDVETKLAGNFSRRITTKAELLHELQFGTSDVLFLVAHSDGDNLFIGGQKVSLAELNALPARQSETPRVAVLISCFAGQLPGTPLTFSERISRLVSGRREKQYLAEILVNKGFFDQVLAPDGEITAQSGVAHVQDALDKLKKNLANPVDGLSRIAEEIKKILKGIVA